MFFSATANRRLTAPHLKIVPGNFGKQRHQHITAVFNGSRKIGIGRLHRSPHAPEHIDFPTGIKARLKEVHPPGVAAFLRGIRIFTGASCVNSAPATSISG